MSSLSPAGSPPAPSPASLPNPRKRPSLSASTAPGPKRRKASVYSTASSSAHPLRQTSFPPDDSAILGSELRSPSVETDITHAHSVAASGVSSSKRGRKRKSGAGADTASVRSGHSAKGTPSRGGRGDTVSRANGAAGGGTTAEDNDGAEEDDDEGLADADVDVEVANRAFAAENARYSALFEVLDEEQQERLTNFRRFHLNEGKVRRIVNQTLSQSVPKSVITAVNSYTKHFVGSLIERAIEIQRHDDLAAIGALIPRTEEEEEVFSKKFPKESTNGDKKTADKDVRANGSHVEDDSGDSSEAEAAKSSGEMSPSAFMGATQLKPIVPTTPQGTPIPPRLDSPAYAFKNPLPPLPDGFVEDLEDPKPSPEEVHKKQTKAGEEIMIGPLRPDSLREALRRIKKEGEYGGVGAEGFSTGLGVPGSRASTMSGRRLFK